MLEGNKQLVKYTSSTYTFSKLKAIVVWGEPIDPAIASKCLAPVHSWEDFLKVLQLNGPSGLLYLIVCLFFDLISSVNCTAFHIRHGLQLLIISLLTAFYLYDSP